uniref:Uncharacterized protein n=1 Tax=Chromera velia CCMP2878 TaxID=1169474 RepID=A0A0G4FMK8_9ALVE|eukprot:Cvel_3510.t1-p1 / transcript=Cvel_3510.t1 / gene=Cvel_3510 / organism=Chromera_velia_CCMP2878 / gene_product=hypothetical protein / transcript_product=hypothetical protein / location=Cvel_scaffold142:36451-37674(+) / protein_length=209 / sequence_SO=supercontig / SO=protein_coding / is_pseudo=false
MMARSAVLLFCVMVAQQVAGQWVFIASYCTHPTPNLCTDDQKLNYIHAYEPNPRATLSAYHQCYDFQSERNGVTLQARLNVLGFLMLSVHFKVTVSGEPQPFDVKARFNVGGHQDLSLPNGSSISTFAESGSKVGGALGTEHWYSVDNVMPIHTEIQECPKGFNFFGREKVRTDSEEEEEYASEEVASSGEAEEDRRKTNSEKDLEVHV